MAGSCYYGFPTDLPVKTIEWQTNFSEANMYIDTIMINTDTHNTQQHDTPKVRVQSHKYSHIIQHNPNNLDTVKRRRQYHSHSTSSLLSYRPPMFATSAPSHYPQLGYSSHQCLFSMLYFYLMPTFLYVSLCLCCCGFYNVPKAPRNLTEYSHPINTFLKKWMLNTRLALTGYTCSFPTNTVYVYEK